MTQIFYDGRNTTVTRLTYILCNSDKISLYVRIYSDILNKNFIANFKTLK
jgi:hypothetical protein